MDGEAPTYGLRFLPSPLRQALVSAARFPTRRSVNTAAYWLRRHQREVRILREKVDARIDRRRAEYQARGLSPDHRGFITPTMREYLELIYAYESGVSAAMEEIKRLKAEVERRGT